jgi:hypothetical protein
VAALLSPLAALAGLFVADAGAAPPRVAPPTPQELQTSALTSAATERAVQAGLVFLAGLQERAGDGSFAITDVDKSEYAPLGVSALCTLAFLASGSAPGRGPHGAVAARAVDYLLLHTDLGPESKQRGYISVGGDALSRTHGHGYATLVLAEAYGMAPGSDRIRAALVAAVERIAVSQGSEGGWGYDAFASTMHEGSVTICMVQALRAARDAGIQVESTLIARAEDYVRRLQSRTGLFCYTLGDEKRTSVGLTAAAISTLNAAGRYDDRAIQSGIDAIWSGLGRREEDGKPSEFPEYERLYLAQAFWQLSDTRHFERWFEDERARLLRTQDDDGSWRDSRFGAAYATAVNCLVLSLPDAALPVFQR